jgi:hypothetical protein
MALRSIMCCQSSASPIWTKDGIPDALFGPALEPGIDRVPLAIALMHVAPGAADPQHIKHAIEKSPIIMLRSGLPATLCGKELFDYRPSSVRLPPTIITPHKEEF